MKTSIKYAAVIAGSIMLPAMACYAGTWVPKWGINTHATYDDNFFMDETDQDTWRYSVKPELSLHYLTPAIESSVEAELAVRRYSEFDEFDSEDPAIRWDSSIKAERTTWTLGVGYQENSQRDFADLDTGQFNSNAIVETSSVEPGVSYQLTEKDVISLSFGHIERDYDSLDFADNENDSANIAWQHQLNQRWTTTVSGAVSEYTAERPGRDLTETDYENLTAGIVYQYAEGMTIDLSLGYFNSDQHRVVVVGPLLVITDDDNSGTLATLGFASDQPINDWSVNLQRGLYPSSQGQVEERDSVNVSYERKLSERSAAGIHGAWHDTESELNARESTEISPYYNYRLTPRLRLEASYSYRSFDRQTGNVNSNRIKAGLLYSF